MKPLLTGDSTNSETENSIGGTSNREEAPVLVQLSPWGQR